jgi:c-di-GMP-related signal transduction protein
VLCDGRRRAFLNCARNTLIGGLVTPLPSHTTVVEILDTVPVDSEVVNACQRLKEAGYLIALDNFLSDDPREPLAEMGPETYHARTARLISKSTAPGAGACW